MNVIWFDRDNSSDLAQSLNPNTLAAKCANYNSSLHVPVINIICQNEASKNQIIHAFDNLHDNFDGLQLRLAWIDDAGTDSLEGLEHESIYIGDDYNSKAFEKIFARHACMICNKGTADKISIGYQRHLNMQNHPLSIGLGELKNDPGKAESILRRSEAIFFNLNAIRRQDSYVKTSCVTGLNIYEACALTRHAGMAKNNKLVIFNVGEEILNRDRAEVTTMLVWYYLEGSINQNLEKIEHNNNKLYMVTSPYFDSPIKFIQGNITGRWWYQNPETLYYVPCTEEDYLEISKGRIPDDFLLESTGVLK